MSALGVFAAAFLFLIGAAAAVIIAQFTGSRVAPWLSLGYSAAAILCSLMSLRRRPRS